MSNILFQMNGSSSSTGLSSTRRLPTRLTSSQSVVGGERKCDKRRGLGIGMMDETRNTCVHIRPLVVVVVNPGGLMYFRIALSKDI